VQYANGDLESFRKLLTACMCCSGLVGSESLVFGDDTESLWNVVGAGNRGRGIVTIVINHDDEPSDGFDLCRDVREGLSLDDGAQRYQKDFRRVLTWLVNKSEPAGEALAFLWTHGRENITIKAEVNTNKDLGLFYVQSASEYGSIASPICKFILDRIDRYNETCQLEGDDNPALQNDRTNNHNERLSSEIIPLGICTTCEKFMVVVRRSKRYCSDKCRVQDNQAKMTKAEKATKMKKYRADKKQKHGRKVSAIQAKLQVLGKKLHRR
jgi:hypothetical protein